MVSISGLLTEVKADLNGVNDLFYSGKQSEGYAKLAVTADKLQMLAQHMDENGMSDRLTRMNPLLARIISSIEKKEIVLVRDLIQYELLALLDEFDGQ